MLTEPTAFDGRSDYGPFIAVGIPAGGLFTGAEGIKTEEQAGNYGGTADEAYDVCYHAECDTIENVDLQGLDEMTDAAAHAVMVFATIDLPEAAPAAKAQGGWCCHGIIRVTSWFASLPGGRPVYCWLPVSVSLLLIASIHPEAGRCMDSCSVGVARPILY